MKSINAFALLLAASLVLTSCQEDYDPIGNNKPAPVLKIDPQYLRFDGAGGSSEASVKTNVASLDISTPPSWIQAVLSEDRTQITASAQANDDPVNIRMGTLQITTETGENEATQYLHFVQAAKDGMLTFDAFDGKTLDPNWQKSGTGKVTIGGGQLTMEENSILTYRAPRALVSQPNNVIIASVDVKGGEGGLQVYLNDDPNNAFSFFFSINSETGTGGFFAFHGSTPMALGDQIPGDPLNGTDMPAIPAAGERDDYFRIEFTNAPRWPNWWQSEVNIYSLKTSGGQTKVLAKHYTRKFEIDGPKPQPGYFAIWTKGGSCSFKNFILSAQQH
ncbi:hypothetical protein [Compostibacter hankyongensis]|uniref:BACON domain-containing protein n=1 Tax=Compostibacter hankyongensis TaxID=1007089 RepID=A0ABP8FXA7_9BACT